MMDMGPPGPHEMPFTATLKCSSSVHKIQVVGEMIRTPSTGFLMPSPLEEKTLIQEFFKLIGAS